MSYKTFIEQRAEHVQLLREQGLDVVDLILNTPRWVRCHAINSQEERRDLAYISTTQQLKNGLTGLRTSYRGTNGLGSYKTYGYGSDDVPLKVETPEAVDDEATRKRAYGFWINSSTEGSSPYLDRKEVGSHGLRFRGTTVVVPLCDVRGILRSYQLINEDGSKIFMKESSTKGLFHWVKKPRPGEAFGLAEGYTTAATIFELTGLPIAACMSAQNLVDVVRELNSFFPRILIYLFADNDKHLDKNIGILKAKEAQAINQNLIHVVAPDFEDIQPSKDSSDWNDLIRLKGWEFTRNQLRHKLSLVHR